MKYKIKLYYRILKSIFLRSREAKWIVLMASLVITMVSLLSSVSENVEKSFLQAIHQTSQYDYMIVDLEYEEAKDYLEHVSNEYPEASYVFATNAFQMDIPGTDFYLNVIGMEGDCSEIYRLNMVEGEYPQSDKEIVLDERFRDFVDENCKIGDEVTLEVLSRETLQWEKISYRICGFFAPQSNAGYELYGFLNLQGANLALEREAGGSTTYVVMVCAGEVTTEEMLGMLYNLDDGLRSRVVNNPVRFQMIWDKEETGSSFVKGFRSIGIMIAITSFALLFNMFQMTTIQKFKQLGLLRCIGLNRKQLLTGLFLNLLLYLVCSMGIGYILFAILEKLFGQIFMNQFLNGFHISEYVDMQWHFNVASFLQSALLVFLIMLLVYWKVVWRIMKMTPLAAVDYRGEAPITASGAETKEKNVITFLGKRNLRRNRWRSIYTGMTVFIVSFLVCTIVTVLGNIDLFNVDGLKKGNLFDYEFYGDSENSFLSEQDLDRISELQGIELLCGARNVCYEFFQEKEAVINSDTLVVTRVYEDEVFSRICEDNNINYDELLGESVVFLLSAEPKKTDKVVLYNKQHEEVEIPIDAVISKDNYQMGLPQGEYIYLVMNEAAARELLGCVNYNRLFVKVKNHSENLELIKSYLQSNEIVMYYSDLKANNSDAREQLKSLIHIAIYLVCCVGLMAVVNIICTISINIQMRMREYGIVMSMGMSRKQIIHLIVFEIMTVVERAIVIALPFSIVTASGMMSVMDQEPNLLKVLIMAVLSALAVYGISYWICFAKGRHDFSKNILGLMQKE